MHLLAATDVVLVCVEKMHTQGMYSVYTVQFATYYSRKLDNVDEK